MKREVEFVDFPEWVREKRKKKGLAQYQLAKMIPCNENTLHGYLAGNNRMPLDVAEKICTILGAELVIREKGYEE